MQDKDFDPKTEDAILQLARTRFANCSEADREDREEAKDDLRFLKGGENQWDASVKAERESAGRPCLTINKLPTFHDQIIGDQRMNRTSITVRAVDSKSDPETAKVLTGLIRNIENVSDAEVAYDHAFEMSSGCGRGYFRFITDYESDDSFDQEIFIKRVANPFTVRLGPHNEIDGSDAPYGFVEEKISREEYKNNFPDKTPREFDTAEEDETDWTHEDQITIAEYFYKVPKDGKLYLLEDGTTTREKPKSFVKERPLKTWDIKWAKIDGYQILEGPTDWPGRYIPIVPVWGKEINIDGKRYTRGCIRHAKDAQRLYNYFRSTDAETVALQPRIPYMLTPKMLGSHKSLWDKAHRSNLPYLLFNPDPTMPGWAPKREQPPMVSPGHVEQIQVASEDMKSTTGLYDASLGARTNETSGVAIEARKRQGSVGSFAYSDNLTRSQRHGGRILIDLMPKIYDTERVLRILNEDETERFVQVNTPFENAQGETELYDLSVGKYDVVAKAGPSYSTQRTEAADSMMRFIEAVPGAAPVVSDLVAKNMDWPGAQDIADRLKRTIPPELLDPQDEENQDILDNVQPPAGPPPPPPDPMLPIKLEIEEEKLKQEVSQTEKAQVELSIKRLDLERAAVNPQEKAAR